MRTIPGTELTIKDRYGDDQIIRRTQNGYQIKRPILTPVLALNKEIGVSFGQRVKHLREARGWTLADLCLRADIRSTTPKQRMWEIENSVREGVTLGTVYALAMALGVPVMDLLPPIEELGHVVRSETRKQTSLAVQP